MQTASFSGLIRTLFYILTFYYIFKFLVKLFLPVVVKKVVEKASENMQQQQNHQNSSWQSTRNSDEIVYNTENVKQTRETKKVGDYIDYEEID